ncbi:hypothetical protein, partial [Trichococcus flocculiformis]|uniref:hypothetical protein n=1 Tax=Trichococcus flocculiformis TaxID=82803 RepID=UPI001C43235C
IYIPKNKKIPINAYITRFMGIFRFSNCKSRESASKLKNLRQSITLPLNNIPVKLFKKIAGKAILALPAKII